MHLPLRRITSAQFFPILVVLSIFLVHVSYLTNGFVWLDHGDIESKRAIIPLSDIFHVLINRFGKTGFYRPLVSILFSLEYLVFGAWAPAYHIICLILHLGVVVSAVKFFQLYFDTTEKQAWLAGLIVGIHPFSWFTVGAIPNAPDLLATLCMLLSVNSYIEKRMNYFFFFTILAILSKETAVIVLPGLIYILEFTQKSRKMNNLRSEFRSRIYYIVGGFIIYVVYLFLRFVAVPEVWKVTLVQLSLNEGIGTRLGALYRTLTGLLVPFASSISDATPIIGMDNWKSLFTLFTIVSSITCLFYYKKVYLLHRYFMFMILVLLPGLSIIPLPRFWALNYGYFATLGIGLVLSTIWMKSMSLHNSLVKKSLQLGIIFWIVFAIVSRVQSGFRLKNDLILFGAEVKNNSQFSEGAYYLGNYYWQNKKLVKAEYYYRLALQEKPQYVAYVDRSSTLINLAGVKFNQGDIQRAEQILLTAIHESQGTDVLLARYNLALIYYQQQKYNQVVKLLDGFINGWDSKEPWLLLIKTYVQLDQKEDVKRTIIEAWPYLDQKSQTALKPFITKE